MNTFEVVIRVRIEAPSESTAIEVLNCVLDDTVADWVVVESDQVTFHTDP